MLLLLLTACAAPSQPEPTPPFAGPVIATQHFAARAKYNAPNPVTLPAGVRAVIVPHHDTALKLAANLLAGLEGQPYETVILLGPNHSANGPRIATARAAFSTWDGLLPPCADIINALSAQGIAGVADKLFEEEHSVGSVVPLITRYLPGARIVPLIIRKGTPFADALRALETARDFAGPDTLVVASVDFAHGVPPRAELARRSQMIRHIETLDAEAVLALDETCLDAPAVLAALLRAMRDEGLSAAVTDGANSAELLGAPLPEVTGYITGAFM